MYIRFFVVVDIVVAKKQQAYTRVLFSSSSLMLFIFGITIIVPRGKVEYGGLNNKRCEVAPCQLNKP